MEDKIEVLCCCNPSNLVGFAPVGLPFETREWQDADGKTGIAYISEATDWNKVEGFEIAKDKDKDKKKKWRKTWR